MHDTTAILARQSVELSDEQRDVVRALTEGVRHAKRSQTLGGYAGTGKTTLIRVLKDQCPDMAVVAYTGKAACILRRKGITDATTIHSRIYETYYDEWDVPHFRVRCTMGPDVGGFIVDEGSMVGRTIYSHLMSFNLPIVFVGDHGQLEPVERGFNLMAAPDFVLKKIHRNSGDIPRFAEWLRHGKPAIRFKPSSRAVSVISADEIDDDVALAVDQIVCAFNQSRVHFNRTVRNLLGRKEALEVGDRVMCLRNDHGVGLFNGMQGTVGAVAWGGGKHQISFRAYDGIRRGINVDPDQFGKEKGPDKTLRRDVHPFDYAYAITAHKAQGDEWPAVLVFEERCKHWEHARWAYTAASRAQRRLIWVTEGRQS